MSMNYEFNEVTIMSNQLSTYERKMQDKKFKTAYESNFKNKVIKCEKPYKICARHKSTLDSDDLYSHDFDEIIGEIPKEYPFGKKYLVGSGRFRGKNNDGETLWEHFKNTKRESEFIGVIDEDKLIILTDKDIENIEMRSTANKYNI